MNKADSKSIVKLAVKFLLSGTALYFVFQIVDPQSIFKAVLSANLIYFFLAILAFNLSKIVSSFRLNLFYRAAGVYLTERYNLLLYYIGMFYNLFLPGSVGGDTYKVILLKQQRMGSTKTLFMATLLDRVNGLALLVFLTCGLMLLRDNVYQAPYFHTLAWLGFILTIPCYWLCTRLAFKNFMGVLWSTLHLSLWVQLGQLLSAYLILMALGVNMGHLDYLILFMASSVVAVLPFTIGGVGAREMVFLYGYQFLQIREDMAVAFSFLFFSTLTLSSLIGLALSFLPIPSPSNPTITQTLEG